MAVDDIFTCLAPHTVTITPTSTRNNYGEVVTTGTVRTAKAYVDPGVNFDQGDHMEIRHPMQIYILDTDLVVTDVITLPDGTTPQLTSLAIYTAIDGLEHSVVTLS